MLEIDHDWNNMKTEKINWEGGHPTIIIITYINAGDLGPDCQPASNLLLGFAATAWY